MKEKIIEIFVNNLLKQLHKVQYMENGYPIEAVPKATILELDALVNDELSEILHLTDISDEEIEIAALKHAEYGPPELPQFNSTRRRSFREGVKWYRSQINNK